ncbi:MAG: CapA family protein [Rudaea sp.]
MQAPTPSARRAHRRGVGRFFPGVAAAFLFGLLVGWLVLGWGLWPARPAVGPAELQPDARIDYVSLTVDAWTATGDVEAARARLVQLDPAEVSGILSDLAARHTALDEKREAMQVTAFADAFGFAATNGREVAPGSAAVFPSPTLAPSIRIAVDPRVPQDIRGAIETWAVEQKALLVAPGDRPQVLFSPDSPPGAVLLSERVYAVVDRMATLRTGITLAGLRTLAAGQPLTDGTRTLLLTPEAAAFLASAWGSPASASAPLELQALVTRLWQEPTALGIVPFDQLIPAVAALPIDGRSVLDPALSLDDYQLVSRVYAGGDTRLAQQAVIALRSRIPRTNRDPARMTRLVMTGTTAITRSLAWKMEQKKDPAWGARLVAPVLAAADLTQVSNEVPFVDNCTPVLETMTFCSSPRYLETLKLAGVDLVGLTGNHILDYGAAPFLKTLSIYNAAGMRYYGGGRNAADAQKTLYVEDHGNRLAFIGANSFGPRSIWATAQTPGASRYDAQQIAQAIGTARSQADVVLFELQAEETYAYTSTVTNQLQFRAALNAGADVVNGVMSHHPQGLEFSPDGRRLILYGLGNLFFDQIFDLGVRQGLVARHTIYAGHLIQTELLATMRNDDYQLRWATPAERQALLRSIYQASGYK